MKWLAVFMAMLLFTGCGLFRKTSRERISHVRESASVEVDRSGASVKSVLETNTSVNEGRVTQTDGKTHIYPSRSGHVTVNSDGSVTGAIDSVVSTIRTLANEVRQTVTGLKSSLDSAASDSTARLVSVREADESDKRESVTDWKLYVWITAVVVAVAVILVFIFKIKKPW